MLNVRWKLTELSLRHGARIFSKFPFLLRTKCCGKRPKLSEIMWDKLHSGDGYRTESEPENTRLIPISTTQSPVNAHPVRHVRVIQTTAMQHLDDRWRLSWFRSTYNVAWYSALEFGDNGLYKFTFYIALLCTQEEGKYFVARQHAMHAERDITLPNLSVCSSVQCRNRV